MPIATFRGEKSVADIADKMYARLTPKQREKATVELLKANPQLKDLSKVASGAVLRIPTLKDIRPKTTRNLENPDVQLAQSTSEALATFTERFDIHVKAAQEDSKAQQAQFKQATVKRILDSDPVLSAHADKAVKQLAARGKTLDARQADVSAALRTAIARLEGKPRKSP